MTYVIQLTNGTTIPAQHSARAPFSTYQEALAACKAEWPEAEIGHDGDLTGGGDRTLVWSCEADSIDDDGGNAVASIVEAS